MKTLTEFKAGIKQYYDSYLSKQIDSEPWEDYWEMIFDTLMKHNAIIMKNQVKYVKEVRYGNRV